jgi:hypothetical protein
MEVHITRRLADASKSFNPARFLTAKDFLFGATTERGNRFERHTRATLALAIIPKGSLRAEAR